MSDFNQPLAVLSGGNNVDSEQLTGAGGFQTIRQRMQIAGSVLAEIVRVMNSTPAGTEYGLVVRQSGPVTFSPLADLTTGSTALGVLNATIQIAMAGYAGAGMVIGSGLVGTIAPELSFDGGTNWVLTSFADPATGTKVQSLTNPAANTQRTIVGAGGASHARVRVSAYTSGSANATMRAAVVDDPSIVFAGPAAGSLPLVVAQVGGSDGSALRALKTDSTGNLNVNIVNSPVGVVARGVDAVGAAATVNPVAMAGNDGSLMRALKTDTSGNVINVGAAAAGAAIAGNPVMMGGSDGSLARAMLMDAAGRPKVALYDASSNPITLKAASTAVVAGDTALPVGLHPSSPLPAGTNAIGTVKLTDNFGQNITAFPAGFMRVSDEPRQLFYDPFDGVLDTSIRWVTPATFSGGVAASTTAGALTLGSGTTANGFSVLQSQPSFIPTIPGWLGVSFALKIPNPTVLNQYMFWGAGTHPTTPSTTAPLTDAYGFELYTDQKLYAVVYNAGVRTVIADLSAATGTSKQPTDGLNHRYIIYYRTDKIFYYIDGLDGSQLVASTTTYQGPGVQTLPVKVMSGGGATPPVSSGVINITGLAVWDTAKANIAISDGLYPWRKVTIKPASTPAVATDNALVVMGADVGTPTATAPTYATQIAGKDVSGNLQIPQVDKILGQTVTQMSVAATISSPGAAARGAYAYVNAYGTLRVSPESTNLFNDSYDQGVDAAKWTVSKVSGGGSIAFSNSVGTVSASTAASAYAVLTSVPSFTNPGSTFLIYATVVALSGPSTGSHRMWGLGLSATTPTAPAALASTSTAVTDFIGFEYDTAGNLYAVIYQNATNIYRSAALTAPGTATTRYGFQMRADVVIFYTGTTEYPAASANYLAPNSTLLPVLALAVNGGSILGTPSQVLLQATGIGDSGKNSNQISDGTYPWRKMSITAAGRAQVDTLIAASTVGTLSSVAATTTPSTTLIVANTNRKGVTIYNDSASATLYLACGAACTTSSHKAQLPPSGYFEVPYGYTGIVTGVWSAAVGSARIEEQT